MFFSIVMPCYNVATTVGRTIESVGRQTFTDFELLAIDDGSVDETAQVLSSVRDLLPASAELRVISQENRGAGAARNRGMREARGELIAFLDADDLWSSHYLAAVAAVFRERPQVDALCSNSWDQHADGYHLNVRPVSDEILVIDDFFDAWSDGTIVLRTSGVTVRSSAVASAGYMREDLPRAQDYEYWSRLGAAGVRWGFLPQPLVLYDGVRADSLSRNPRRFVDAPSPEAWSRDIWPLLGQSTLEGFRKFYISWTTMWCWQEMQSGLDEQAKATAQEALPRVRTAREKLVLLSMRYVPGAVHRLVWRTGSPVKRAVFGIVGRGRVKPATSELLPWQV